MNSKKNTFSKPVSGRVLAFGTFDLLHEGHLSYFAQARRLGKELVVIVARDKNVFMFKGFYPVHGERTRLKIVRALSIVDNAVLGESKNFFGRIKKFNPEFIALGYDQWPGKTNLESHLAERGIGARVVRLRAYKKHVHKTTKIKEKIRNSH